MFEQPKGPRSPGNANLPIGAVRPGGPGNANLPIGAVRPRNATHANAAPRILGWHSREYLPHFESAATIQHVSFHLADSLAQSALQKLAAELKTLPAEKRDVERRKRIEAWIDAGHGSCLMREPRIADMVQESLLSFDAQRYRLLAWVVMPNHVHVLFEPINIWSVAKIVASWKKFTARKICDMIASFPGNANLPIGSVAGPGNANLLIGSVAGPGNANLPIGSGLAPQIKSRASIWHREYWDRYIRDAQHLKRAIEYIHQNPVKASLVANPEAYRWSSAHFLGSTLGTPISRLAP